MKKIRLYLLLVFSLLLFTSCESNIDREISNEKENISENKTEKPEIPKLDIEVTEDMDFFNDGYEIVSVDTYLDGDTTKFKLKSGVYTTRYLAIDTPETSNGLDPWGISAKDYVNNQLKNAKTIVIQRDPILNGEEGEENSSLDKYNRLLAHVFVDGELLQYKVVNESLAFVKYLYFDYLYNTNLIQLESYVRENDFRRVHNTKDLDPSFDYSHSVNEMKLSEITRDNIGLNVKVEGVVTAKIGKNAFIQDENQNAIYIYTKNTNYNALEVGNKVSVTGNVSLYQEQLQIANLAEPPILLQSDVEIVPRVIEAEELNSSIESEFVKINNIEINSIGENNCEGVVENTKITIRFDKAVIDKISPDSLEVGKKYDLIGNVGIYNGNVQLMISEPNQVISVK